MKARWRYDITWTTPLGSTQRLQTNSVEEVRAYLARWEEAEAFAAAATENGGQDAQETA